MTTELIRIRGLLENFEDFVRAGNILKDGGVVAIPTETVYGLAANALDADAVKKIFTAKGRPQDNPLIVHIADFEDISKLVLEIPESAITLAEHFWPGPLTMIFKKSDKIPAEVSAGLSTVAIRLPSNKYARAVIEAAGVPLAAPSANLSGKPSPTSAQHVMRDLSGKIPMILDGGTCEVGLESTVIDLTGDVPTLLRPGGVTLSELRKVLGTVSVNPKILEEVSDNEPVASPGMKYKHYAPGAPVVIIDGDAESFKNYVLANKTDKKVAILCFDEEVSLFEDSDLSVVSYGSRATPSSLAENLFSALRTLDDISPDIIYARQPDCSDGIELAVVNRLSRAAAFTHISL
ncbi:MAG: threonylcarbamoyl-AMP synthase [Oscillospiraceae bacterium]|nr:threonylcarbamoyl-AMP synthase [Oscillospiraceae bacterium]